MHPKLLFAVACILIIFASCHTEIGNIKDVNPETVYTGYRVTYEAGDSIVSILAQFTFVGPNGTTLVLNNPAKIELDGDSIHVDSTTGDGAFYEVKKPVTTFIGNHNLVFTSFNGKQYSQPFTFNAATLATKIPSLITRETLPLSFKGMTDHDSVRLQIMDTSGASNGIDTMLLVTHNAAFVAKAMLQRLHPGRLTIRLDKEENLPMPNTTKQGGKFAVLQTLGEWQTTLRQ